jgi:poly(3-hydroxybutyrate) depolymerase
MKRAVVTVAVLASLSCGSDPVASDSGIVGRVVSVDAEGTRYKYHFYIPRSARSKPVAGIVHIGGEGPWESPNQDYELQPFAEPSGLIMLWVNFPQRNANVSLDDQGWPGHPDHHNFKTARNEFFRPDLKFIEVLEHFRSMLEGEGFVVDPRIFMAGFSSGGMWANRFPMLHPELVKATAVGGAGLILLPVSAFSDGTKAKFPFGIGDFSDPPGGAHPHGGIGVGAMNIAALREVAFFVFVGELDLGNDPVHLPEMPEQAALYESQFGNRVQRGVHLNQLLQQLNVSSTHRVYANVGHLWTDQMKQDVIDFFLSIPLER